MLKEYELEVEWNRLGYGYNGVAILNQRKIS